MALIVLTSARGAPGVTTTALALTLNWHRPVILIEADVTGSSSILAGYFSTAVEHTRGLIDLATAHQRGQLSWQLHALTLPLPIDRSDSDHRFLPGLQQAVQAASMPALWPTLAAHASALDQAGTDVIVDAGRLGTAGGPEPLIRAADTVLLLTRTQMTSIAAINAVLPSLRRDLAEKGSGDDTLSIVTVGNGRPYEVSEIRASLGVPVLATVAWDPPNAEVYSDGAAPNRRHEHSAFVRSIRALNSAVVGRATGHHSRIAGAAPDGDRHV